MENNTSKKDKGVMYICNNHLENKTHWTPLLYNNFIDKMVCPKCNAQYDLFMGSQVLWSEELEQKVNHYSRRYAWKYVKPIATIQNNGNMHTSFTHDTPLEQAPAKPEPSKSFEQLLHDFITNWKENNPMNDGHDHSRSSKVLFDLYSAKAQVGWTDFQIKQYFGIPTDKNLI